MNARTTLPFLWMLLSSFSFALMGTSAHALNDSCDWQIVALARTALVLVFVIMFLLKREDLRDLQQFDRSRAKFRTWLHQIVLNCVRDWCKHPAQRQEKGTDAVRRLLDSEEARRDLKMRLDEEFDLELLDVAEMRVRLLVRPHVWDAYQLFCKEHISLREAAKRISIPAGHVSKYARRVRDMVAREIALLEGKGAPAGAPANGATV